MKNFLHILNKIIIVADKVVPPAVGIVNPALGGILYTIFHTIVAVENDAIENESTATTGELKKGFVLHNAVVTAKEAGVTLDATQLSLLIDRLVAALNVKDPQPQLPVNLGKLDK